MVRRDTGIHPTLCRRARSDIATLPRRIVRYLLSTPLGRTVRYLPLAFKPRTCRRPGLQACPRPTGPSGEGRAPGRVRLAPLDYRTRPIWRPLPEVARRSRPTPMPTARGPHSKETARSLTCELSWPSTMLVRVPSGRQPIIDLSRYSSILMGGGIGVGRLARQVRGE
jgi:hypothetical protein